MTSFFVRRFLIFPFLYFLLLPALAEKGKNSIPTQEEIEKSVLSSYYKGFYDGTVLNTCPMYVFGIINNDTKIDMIEISRKKLYKYSSFPKDHELKMMKIANEEFNDIKPCFPEIEK